MGYSVILLLVIHSPGTFKSLSVRYRSINSGRVVYNILLLVSLILYFNPSVHEDFISLGRSFQILTPEILIDSCVLLLFTRIA